MRLLTRRDGTEIGIHRLDDDPIAKDVKPTLGTPIGDAGDLGGAPKVADFGAERLGDPLVLFVRKSLGRKHQQHRRDAQTAEFLLASEQRNGRGVAKDSSRTEFIEAVDEFLYRRMHREIASEFRQKAAGASPPGETCDRNEMATGGVRFG